MGNKKNLIQIKKSFPKIKQSLKDFVEDESGIITKEAIIKGGIAIGGILTLSQSALAHHVESYSHTNSLSLTIVDAEGEGAMGEHSHSVDHSSGC